MENEYARVRPNWVALSIVLAAGLAAGFVPFLAFLHAPYLTIPYLSYALIVVPWRGRAFMSNATERPGPLEWLLAGWNTVGVGASGSLVGFVWYGLAYLVLWAAGYGVRALRWNVEIHPATIATYVSALFVGAFALAAPFLVVDEVPPKLYPPIAGTRSAYFPLAVQRWKIATLALLGVAGVVAGLAWLRLDPQGLGLTLSLALYLVVTGGKLSDLGERRRPSAGAVDALKALSALFSAAGYALTEKPRTGNPEVDPLITSVDLLALAGDRGYAIKLKVAGSGEAALEWPAASDVRRAAKTLQRALRAANATETEIEPFLLVVGGRVSEDLRIFAGEEGVKLMHFPALESLRPETGPETAGAGLRAVALSLLQVPPGGPAMAVNAQSGAASA